MHWFINPIKYHYADFGGRATRKEFWMFILFSMLFVGIPLGIIWVISPTFALVIYICFIIAIFVPNIALTIRRLHDIGKSGWWLLLSLVPYIGGLVMLVFYCLPSQSGTNKYGPNKYETGAMFGSATGEPTMTPTMPVQASSTVVAQESNPERVVGYDNDTKE